MKERIVVTVNGRRVTLYRGMQVKHALIAYDGAAYEAAVQGRLSVEDAHGFRLGLEGSLNDEAKLFTRWTDGTPQSEERSTDG